ncbi:MAG: HAD hydrolase family protein [Bacteroidetes bacterium]|jgi:3-deoxy-D-manno-octulosonate 8-phosphate phosphatase (KDO 8-P phosphatase)|nr:HAD hydrolase family protein [Bacteroidota bacterium]
MNLLQLFKPIKVFAFDIDGVLTDGTVLVLENGEQLRRMNIKDGYALQLAVKKGFRVMAVSGADSQAAKLRLNKLGIEDVFLKVLDKKKKLENYLQEHELKNEELLFMGDDIPDLSAIKMAGLGCAPSDAVPEIREAAKYISPFIGGMGCVRDVVEKVLKLNSCWDLDEDLASR